MLKLVALVAAALMAVCLAFTCFRPPAGAKIGTRARLLCLGALCVATAWWGFAEPSKVRNLRWASLINCGDRTFEELIDGFLKDAVWKYYPRHDVLLVTGTVRPDAAGIPPQPPLRARFVVALDYYEALEEYRGFPVSPWVPPMFDNGEGDFAAVENPEDARLLGYERFVARLCPRAEESGGRP